jgi:signal transduction histidine kinase
MEALVDGLMTLARIDAEQPEFCHAPLDLREVVETSVALLHPMAERQHVNVQCELQSAQVVGDAERLGHVVANLLDNAIAYNHVGGQVQLRLTVQAADAVLTVSDTGIGIEERDLPRVFERFYRADRARTGSTSGGAGLGLAICREIVQAHRGTICASSKLGNGSTFTVRLPIRLPEANWP